VSVDPRPIAIAFGRGTRVATSSLGNFAVRATKI
jgi:hypothetical protein